MKIIYTVFVLLFFRFNSIAQQVHNNLNINGPVDYLKIVAHTDSNLYFLSSKITKNSHLDFFISKHNAFEQEPIFDNCLNLTKVFTGGVNPKSDNFNFIQQKNHINLLFTAIGEKGKILLGKTIGFNGSISESFVIDRVDNTNNNVEKCEYNVYSTNKKNILIHVNRIYVSGFRRDKCILLDQNCNKIWEYELPPINGKKSENIIVDVDNLNQLIYYPWEFATEVDFNSDGKPIFQSIYRQVKDTVLPLKLGRQTYHQKFRTDSLKLLFVNPANNSVVSRSFYYPFVMTPVIKSITSSQLLMYSMVDIDDERFLLIGKKAMYYKRFDLKNNTILLDTLVVLNEKMQQKLMHTYAPESIHPTSKYFKLFSDNIVGGDLLSVYEHGSNGQYLEVFASKFNLTTNKPEWTCLLPRKINVYYPNIYDLVVRKFNDTVSISYYEHRKNLTKNSENYVFKKYKLLRKTPTRNFISYNISSRGEIYKNSNEIVDRKYLYPCLNSNLNSNFLFISRDFIPQIAYIRK